MDDARWVDSGRSFSDEELSQDIDEMVQPYLELLAARRAEAEVARDIPRRTPIEHRAWDKKVARSIIYQLGRRLDSWEDQEGFFPQAVLDDHVIRPRGAVIVWEDWFAELLDEVGEWAIYTISLGQRGSGRGRRSIRSRGWRMVNDYKAFLQSYNEHVVSSPERAYDESPERDSV